jgi:tRNA(Ile)-lysidine synthase
MAHHKDDFIETALMQQKSNRLPSYFGIKRKNYLYEMHIYRPYVLSY